MLGKSPEVLNFNRLFLELNRFICNQLPVSPWTLSPMSLVRESHQDPSYIPNSLTLEELSVSQFHSLSRKFLGI